MSRNLHGMEKTCTKCHKTKPLSEFFKDKRNTGPRGKGVAADCKECSKVKKRKWYDDNPDYYKTYNADYYAKHATRQKVRKYGMEVEEYEALLAAQDGVCKICGEPSQDGRALAVDHDHQTGRVRSLLCNNCNNGLGRFRDSPELLEKAANYIRVHSS